MIGPPHARELGHRHVARGAFVLDGRGVRRSGAGEERLGGVHLAQGGEQRESRGHPEHSHQDEKLSDEVVEPREAERRKRHDQEDGGEHRLDLEQPPVFRYEAGVASLVEDPDEEEEGPGRDAVVDHL